ncbi:MAG: hypothetical protein Rubg2KO_20160 [Rubricoccaceae bacterium]
MRGLVFASFLLVAGCDTSGIDAAPFTETLIVEIENETVLRLTTDGAPGCMTPMVVQTGATSDGMDVDVLGLELAEGVVCLGIIPSTWTTTLPEFEDSLELAILHRGETDLYVIRDMPGGRQLVAVRTSSTRPGPR